jgi:hypothetical protein
MGEGFPRATSGSAHQPTLRRAHQQRTQAASVNGNDGDAYETFVRGTRIRHQSRSQTRPQRQIANSILPSTLVAFDFATAHRIHTRHKTPVFLLELLQPRILYGHPNSASRCPLSGVKRTLTSAKPMSAFGPKRTLGGRSTTCA